ncbi:MAG: tetratricopeptide repeat protein, partial [Gammaproteobacteria bacterium]
MSFKPLKIFACMWLVVGMVNISVLNNSAYASVPDTEPLLSETSADFTGGDSLAKQGDEYFQRGLYNQAIREWRNAYKSLRKQDALQGQVLLLYKIATAQRQLGLHDRAIRGLEVANKLLRLITAGKGNDELQITVKANLAGAYLYAGRFEQAKPLLLEARNLAEKSGRLRLAALIYNDFGNLYGFQGQTDKALHAFDKSRELAGKVDDTELVVQALTNAVLLASDHDLQERAVRDLDSALNAIGTIKPSFEKARASLNLGAAAYDLLRRKQLMDTAPAMAAVKLLD